jgi:hypothetical protein
MLNMSNSETTLQAIKLKGYIGSDQKIEINEHPSNLPEGDVEVILIYNKNQNINKHLSPLTLPSLHGGRYLGGSLRREDIYDDDGR